MREIKFRVWDKISKKIRNVRDMHWGNYSSTPEIEFECKDYLNQSYDSGEYLMQYTGLKDINGKEIYEGDIVEFYLDEGRDEIKDSGYWYEENKKDDYYFIRWKCRDCVDLSRFRYWLKHESFGYDGEETINPSKCKVIGNVYDNKELLELKT